MEQKNKISKFHGVERDKIEWHPIIDESKCIGCGMCVTSCGKGVYEFDYENKKSKVVNPMNCMVACQTCANLCPSKAISFAENDNTREKAQKIVRENNLLPKVKEELNNRREDLKYIR